MNISSLRKMKRGDETVDIDLIKTPRKTVHDLAKEGWRFIREEKEC